MESIEDIKSDIASKVNFYFENKAKSKSKPGIFGELIGKLEVSKGILESAGQIAIDEANKYHKMLNDEQEEDLRQFIKNLIPSSYKKWFLNK